jgi:small GTP-binding protein
MSFTVAIVGRPNVGKSTLFNRLVGASRALVDPTPGVTRDRITGAAHLGHLTFTAIDTAGLDEGPPESLEGRLRQQTATALAEADVALMLIDAKSGLTALDRHFARWLRRAETPVILVANKCEGLPGAWGSGRRSRSRRSTAKACPISPRRCWPTRPRLLRGSPARPSETSRCAWPSSAGRTSANPP